MRSDLFASNLVGAAAHSFTLQNPKALRVTLAGNDVLARAGAMVAYDGFIQFAWEPPNLEQALLQRYTKEGMLLMSCSGQGDVFLADRARDISLLYLEGEGITCNGVNVLAFERSVQWSIVRLVAPPGMGGNQGMWNVVLHGTGWVALTSFGPPILMAVGPQSRVAVDPDSVVAWSTDLRVAYEQHVLLTSAWTPPGGRTGEEVQLRVEGPSGYVLVQPSEPRRRGKR